MDIRSIWKRKVRVDVACKIIEKQASIHFATFESKILDIQNQYNIVSDRLLRIERILEKRDGVLVEERPVADSATGINMDVRIPQPDVRFTSKLRGSNDEIRHLAADSVTGV